MKTKAPRPNPVAAEFTRYLEAQNMDKSSIRTFEYGVRRILSNVPDVTEEALTEYLYSLTTGARSNLRLAWKLYSQFRVTVNAPVPVPGYRGKGANIRKAMKASSGDGLRRHHAKLRAEKAEKARKGRIVLTLMEGTTLIGDVEEDGPRIVLSRAVIMQGETLGKLPGKASIPAAREAYRVSVGMDYQVPK